MLSILSIIPLIFEMKSTELNILQFSIILFVVFLSLFFSFLKIEKINKSWKLVALKTLKQRKLKEIIKDLLFTALSAGW